MLLREQATPRTTITTRASHRTSRQRLFLSAFVLMTRIFHLLDRGHRFRNRPVAHGPSFRELAVRPNQDRAHRVRNLVAFLPRIEKGIAAMKPNAADLRSNSLRFISSLLCDS